MAAKKSSTSSSKVLTKKNVSRPGRYSKKRSSKLKASKNYKKLSRGQGK